MVLFMWTHFFFEHAHFSLNVVAALILFAVAWLYFDAWLVSRTYRELTRVVGFILLSLSFLLHGVLVETQAIGDSIIPAVVQSWGYSFTRLSGYLFVIISLLLDPINEKPDTKPLVLKKPPKRKSLEYIGVLPSTQTIFTIGAAPLLSILTGLLYLYRATAGLERHLRPVAVAFFLLTLAEFFSIRSLFAFTNDIALYELLKPYGIVWIIEHFLLLMSMLFLGKWVFSYLLKRFETQLLFFFTTGTITIFLLTSVTFTALLLSTMEKAALEHVAKQAQLFDVVLDGSKQELVSFGQAIANDQNIQSMLTTNKRRELANNIARTLENSHLTSLMITKPDGTLVADGKALERFGTNELDASLQRDEALRFLRVVQTGLLPAIAIQTVVPIRTQDLLVGYVVAQRDIDTALLDGIKQKTGLDISLFTGETLSATTVTMGTTRPLGIIEANEIIHQQVLVHKQSWTGRTQLLQRTYLSSYAPVMNAQQESVGMIFVGQPADLLLASSKRATELTFLVSTLCMILSLFPSYLITRYIVKQIR